VSLSSASCGGFCVSCSPHCNDKMIRTGRHDAVFVIADGPAADVPEKHGMTYATSGAIADVETVSAIH
jgi:hypothetical protein